MEIKATFADGTTEVFDTGSKTRGLQFINEQVKKKQEMIGKLTVDLGE